MDFLTLVTKARTCRRFHEDQPLSMADCEWLVECARRIPSARNGQIVRYTCVTDPAVRSQLFGLTKWAAALPDWGGPAAGERPTAFLGLSLPAGANRLAFVDLGIAAQTIQLAAASRGWGCCIIASFNRTQSNALLRVPEDTSLELILGLGVEKEVRHLADVPESGALTYWRNEAGEHFVPKRALNDLILNRF